MDVCQQSVTDPETQCYTASALRRLYDDWYTVLCVQWREASYTTVEGDVYRVYMVCNVAVTAVDNWLRTPYIDRHQANRLYVDVKFTMRRCTKYPDPVRLQQCKESFKVI